MFMLARAVQMNPADTRDDQNVSDLREVLTSAGYLDAVRVPEEDQG
ncbi:hypothetical protein [Kitasatospora griseola]